MDKLLELAERCEKAMGSDRELDGAIALHAFKPLKIAWGDNDRDATIIWENAASPLQFYTASLDAAITLVPEGWAVIVGAYPDARKPFARLFPPDYANSPLEHQESNDCAGHALALCAAALKARAAQGEGR